jgi:hypothetical protein
MRALASSILMIFSVTIATGFTACAPGGQGSTGRVSSVSSAEEGNPYDPDSEEFLWCQWEWGFGGSPLSSAEVTAMTMRWNIQDSLNEIPCTEAHDGLGGELSNILKVDSRCSNVSGSYSPITGKIRILASEIGTSDQNRTLAHEYGHKAWAAANGFTSALWHGVTSEGYGFGTSRNEGFVYENNCMAHRDWTMSIQSGLPSGGGGGIAVKQHASCTYNGPCIEGHYYAVDDCGWFCGGHVDTASNTCIANCQDEM